MLFSLELTQIEDPREQWRREQERMLKEYLIVAQEALNAKKEIYQIKQQRFELAQEEYQQLHKMCEDDSRSYASCEFTSLFLIYPPASTTRGVRNSVKFHHPVLLWMKITTAEVRCCPLTQLFRDFLFLLGLLEYAFLTLGRDISQLASLAISDPTVVMLHAR